MDKRVDLITKQAKDSLNCTRRVNWEYIYLGT